MTSAGLRLSTTMARFLILCCFSTLFAISATADDWPQWMGPQRDGIWREEGIVREFGIDGPTISWRAAVAGGYAGPSISQGRVFVTDYLVAEGDTSPSPDVRNELQGTERVLCFDEKTGELIWKHSYPRPYKISYPAGPRATPTVDGDRVYVLGAEGDLWCLSTTDGEVIWSRNVADDYEAETPIWGYACHPLIVDDTVICLAGGKDSAAIALDKRTGEERWASLSASGIGYAPPTLIEAGGQRQLIIWHADSVNSVDPKSGTLFWSHALKPDYGMSIAPPLQIGNTLFVGAIKNKSMALRLADQKPAAEVLWRGQTKLGLGPSHCPVLADAQSTDHLYGIDRDGQIMCIRASTGERLWEDYSLMASKRRSNAGTAFLTRNQDVFFILSETAELIIAKLSPDGYLELARSKPLLKPTHDAFGRGVLWSAPAFAQGAMFVRNDEELVRVSLRQ